MIVFTQWLQVTVYVVMSRSRQQRQLVRRLWAGREAARRRLVFLTPEAEAGLAAEQREHDDLVVARLGPDSGPFTEHKLAVAGLDWSRRAWAGAQFTVLARDSVLVNTAAVSALAARHAVSSNRVLGALYKRYSPARAPGAPHHTPAQEWPWRLYPPFLGPHLAIFSQDTLARLLRAVPEVPLFRHPEVWLTALVSLRAEVIRLGLKDSFTPLPGAGDRSPDLDCHWLGRAAMWGHLASNTTLAWVARLQEARARCPAPPLGPAPPRSCDAE